MPDPREPRLEPVGTRPRVRRTSHPHYELFVCGWRGHELVGYDAARVRPEDALFAREDGAPPHTRWLRCLRCDAWVPVALPKQPARELPPAREELTLPLRGKALRDKIVLRLIAIDRAFHFVILGLLAAAIFVFIAHRTQLRSDFYRVLADFQGGVRVTAHGGHGLAHELDKLFSLRSGQLNRVGLVLLGYAVLEGVEAVGLWYQKRWAEYLTFIATTLLLPLEIHELTIRLSVLKISALVINVAVVIYLLLAKRLFGLRGGAAADREERERSSGWVMFERATPPHP